MLQKGLCLRCKKFFERKSKVADNVFFFDCNQHGQGLTDPKLIEEITRKQIIELTKEAA